MKSEIFEIEDFFKVEQNNLLLCGFKAKELADRFGTPLFVFSESRIRRNIDRLFRIRDVIGCSVKLCYAAKANSNLGILRAIRDAGCDIEVNSGGELWKAQRAGFTGQQIIFNGTSKELWEIEDAIQAEIYAIQVDSLYELSLIESVAKKLNRRARVSLRMVPEISSETHSGLQTALLTSKFGMMPEEALEACFYYSDSPYVEIKGIHVHVGSQNSNKSVYREALRFLVENLFLIREKTGLKLEHLNLGGGFPVNYLRNQLQRNEFLPSVERMFAADFEPCDAIAEAWRKLGEKANLIKNLTLVFEPGRSIIADAGICLTTVRNIKQRPVSAINNKDTWLLTDAGFNILLSMETYKWYYQLVHAERAGEPHVVPYRIGGPLCDGADVYFDIEGQGRLPNYRFLPRDTKPGDVLALLNCGAYSISQMFQYNGRFLPCVVLLKRDGKVTVVRRRDSFEDLVNNEELIE